MPKGKKAAVSGNGKKRGPKRIPTQARVYGAKKGEYNAVRPWERCHMSRATWYSRRREMA